MSNGQSYESVCRACHGGCGARLTVEGGRLTRVTPDPESPFSRGRMCPKGLATLEMVYHPSRLLTPLKRVGPRGSGQWQPVSWETALGEIAGRLDGIRTESGPEAIAIGQGTGRHHYAHVIRFANTLGTPNWYEPGLANCFLPRITVCNLTYGGFVTPDYFGEVPPRTILFWGHNPIVSGPDGRLPFPVERVLRDGAFGIAIDPRRSETAKRCGLWLPLRPGTDAALALAMIGVIIREELYDKEFVAKWTEGFEPLAAHVSGFTASWAAGITGVPADLIETAARRYATDRPSVLEWGVAIEQNRNSLQTVRALAILRALTGNIDVPGGDIVGMRILKPYPVMRESLPPTAFAKRLGAAQFKLLGGARATMPSAHIPGVLEAMRTGHPYRIRALLNFGSNPLVAIADSRKVHEALKALDLLVVADMFMTPTAALADYVLPAAMWPEVDQVVEMPFVAANAVLAQQKVLQVGEARQDEEIMIDLARRLNLPGSAETLHDLLNYRLKPLGLSFAELTAKGVVYPPHEYRKHEKDGFRTPGRRIELYSRSLERLGYAALPTYEEPTESPARTPELAGSYPYVLTTGSRRWEFFNSEHRQIPSLRKRRPDPIAELHPDTASRHGIADGEWIWVTSPRGRIRMKARVTEDIARDVVSIDHAWWFPEKEGPEFGVWESNANVLTSADPPYDPAFGSYTLRGLLCRVERA